MKLSRCRISEKKEWRPCIKISDDLGKHMGDSKELKKAFIELGIENV